MITNLGKMLNIDSLYSNQRLTQTHNFSGVYNENLSYEKFDFVYYTGDGLFYYATEDMSFGGGAVLAGTHRFSLDPDGPTVDGNPSHYIYDDFNEVDALGNQLQIGNTVKLEGCQQSNASGDYKVIDIKKDYVDYVDYDSDGTIAGSLGGSPEREGWYVSDWFMVANKNDPDIAINEAYFYVPSSNNGWIFHLFWGWIYVYPEKDNGQHAQKFWFWKNAGNTRNDSSINSQNGVWIFADKAALGNEHSAMNGFIYVRDMRQYKVSASSQLNTLNPEYVFIEDIHGNRIRSEYYESSDEWLNLIISQSEYDELRPNGNLRDRRGGGDYYLLGQDDLEVDSFFDELGPEGWVYVYKPLDSLTYKAGFYNYENESYYTLSANFSLEKHNGQIRTPKEHPTLGLQQRLGDGKLDRIQVQGLNPDFVYIDKAEPAGSNLVTLTAFDQNPAGSDLWVTDRFFFDADYGSSVSFSAKNRRMNYANGYYKVFPVSTNSLQANFNLIFNNRTNKESNAITHFIETHQGQLEKDKNVSYLKYSQGISGFRWDGNSTFHPYDSLDNQSKTFYCNDFSHSLNFEDSNNISVSLKNLNTSILNVGESLYVKSAPTYDQAEVYQKNDVVFSDVNNKYYYWHSDIGLAGKTPVQRNSQWTRQNGKFSDLNTEYWTRDFFWRPSLGLRVSQKPRVNEVSLSSKYTQIYNDGINESLLNLELKFDNRDDDEAYAILHFLESHLGYIPFLFNPPAPYQAPKNFICQRWNHSYKYKDNHLITAVFEQYPFNFTAESFSNFGTQPLVGAAELHFTNPLVFASKLGDEGVNVSKNLKKRLYLENVGGEDVNISSISLDSSGTSYFEILGQQSSSDVTVVAPIDLSKDLYTFTVANSPSLPFSLNGKTVRLESHEDGPNGGQFFTTIDSNGNEIDEFFQKNNGDIKKISSNSSYVASNYFILNDFFKTDATTDVLKPGQRGYIDIVYLAASLNTEEYLIDQNNREIEIVRLNSSTVSKAAYGKLHWEVYGEDEAARYMIYKSDGSLDYDGYIDYWGDLFNHYYHHVYDSDDYETAKILLSRQNGYLSENITIVNNTFLSPQKGKLEIYLNYNE